MKLEKEFIPQERGYSLYLRPTMISTSASLGVHVPKSAKFFVIASPVGPYYKTGFKPVSLFADDLNIRAWPGGTGSYKLGSNYAGTILPALEAARRGYSQILWLFNGELNEVGTMNVFVFWINKQGEKELVTPPLDGLILPGITRSSVLELTREWNEFKVTEKSLHMNDLIEALAENRVIEAFGTGTAAVISPIENIHYKGNDHRIPLGTKGSKTIGELSERLMNTIMSIQVCKMTFSNEIILNQVSSMVNLNHLGRLSLINCKKGTKNNSYADYKDNKILSLDTMLDHVFVIYSDFFLQYLELGYSTHFCCVSTSSA